MASSPSACCLLSLLLSFCFFPTPSSSAPVSPNMSSCHLPYNLPTAETPFNCCAPTFSSSPIPFQPNRSSYDSLKVRRPAHAVDQAYAEKLLRAYNLMRALPPEDPRSFRQQANIHCAYCNTVYTQLNSTEIFQVHGSWLFFSFHRWYLFFHERIMSKLLGDDTFALAFWNYDNPNGSTMPWVFTDIPGLVDPLRDSRHQPPAVVAIDYTYDTDERTAAVQIEENANTFYRSLIRDATTQHKFFGMPYRRGGTPLPGYGTVERRPHNTVHLWAGSRSQVGWKDMGSFYAAARDPMFYAHHANIDRLWEVWKSFEGNLDIDDPDYPDSEFAFYDENAQLVSVKVRDSLDTTNLGFVYEDVENPWMNAVPVRLSDGVANLTTYDTLCTLGELILTPCSVLVERDPCKATTELEEDLLIGDIAWDSTYPTDFDIYINLPTANRSTSTGCVEYVGFFTTVPQFYVGVNETTASYDIGAIVRELNLTREESIIVTIVPRGLNSGIGVPASISSFDIVYTEKTLTDNAWRRQVQ